MHYMKPLLAPKISQINIPFVDTLNVFQERHQFYNIKKNFTIIISGAKSLNKILASKILHHI